MCGICGLIDFTGKGRAEPAVVAGMCAAIAHRGPDGDGFYNAPNVALGMRRLSIIDVDGSTQPIYNEDRSIALMFNGEIYNYRELRRELAAQGHVLRTEGDGETIVHLYETYGLELFGRLRGMYGFALWDANTERLVLAVDHIGMKPLYLHERDGLLRFSSEVKGILADERVPRALNLDVLDTYLSFGYMIGEDTLFDGVRRLPPGYALVADVRTGSTKMHAHWEFPQPMRREQDEALTIQQARELLADSVHMHLRSDVPLGLFLSGGVDSAAVLAMMSREAQGRVKTFTVGYDVNTTDNELLQARRVAEHFGTDHHERVINANDWWEGLQTYVYHHDEPNANSSAVSLLLLAQDTARHVKVVLTGLGGDELFGGYMHHRALPEMLARSAKYGRWLAPFERSLAGVEQWYPAMKRWRVIGALPTYLPRLRHAALPQDEGIRRMMSFDGMAFSDVLRERLYGPELRHAWTEAQHKEKTYSSIIRRSLREDPYDTAQALVINTWLTGNALLAADKVTMAASLEARVPLFDLPMLKFAANVPTALRMRENKYVLREAMRPLLPTFALERPKQPFGTPILNWFDTDLNSRIQEILLDSTALSRDLFERDALERLLRDHFAGKTRNVEVIFRLLVLELWQRRFTGNRMGTRHPLVMEG